MSNFIPHEVKKILPRNNPWITKPLITMIKRKNRLYKAYKNHGYREDDKIRLDNFRLECQKAVEDAKKNIWLIKEIYYTINTQVERYIGKF